MLKLSITRDTANRLGFNPLQRFVHFTRKIRSHFLRSCTLITRWPKHGLPKSSSDHCPALIQSCRSSTSASTVPARVTTKVNQALFVLWVTPGLLSFCLLFLTWSVSSHLWVFASPTKAFFSSTTYIYCICHHSYLFWQVISLRRYYRWV